MTPVVVKDAKEQEWSFKKLVESYRCRICKTPLDIGNFSQSKIGVQQPLGCLGSLGENHGIFCADCTRRYKPK